MPAPEKTSREAVIRAAREIVELRGLEGLTMQAVADRVGVRAPSLYKRVRDRQDLLTLVVEASLDELTSRMTATRSVTDPRARIVRLADVLRAFARDRPVAYGLVFARTGGPPVDEERLHASVAPLMDAAAEVVGPEHALDAARLVTAWATGFIGMELSGALRLGGDVGGAWRWGLDRLVTALG